MTVKMGIDRSLGGLGVVGHSRVATLGRYGPLSGVRACPNRQTHTETHLSRRRYNSRNRRPPYDRGGDRTHRVSGIHMLVHATVG